MKRRKLYYIPGLLSIMGLPVLLSFFGPKKIIQSTCLAIRIPTDRKDEPGMFRLSKEYMYESIIGKKITTIDLDMDKIFGDDKTKYVFSQKMNFVLREIEHLEFTNDTTTVLKIQLGENNTYGEFVWVFNQLILYGVRRFVYTDDNFYVFANPPVNHRPEILVTSLSGDVLFIDHHPKPGRWQIFKSQVEEELKTAIRIIKYNGLYLTGFCLLILLPAILTIRSNRRAVRPIT